MAAFKVIVALLSTVQVEPSAEEAAVTVVPLRCRRSQRRAVDGVPPEVEAVVLLTVVRRTNVSALVGDTNRLACREPVAVVSRKVKPAREEVPTAEPTLAMIVTSPVMG